MAQVRISVIEAFDSTSNGLAGTLVKDMFRPLSSEMVDSTKADEIVGIGMKMCEDYIAANPDRSVMPSFIVKAGRKPRGFDAATTASNPTLRKFLKRDE